MDWADTPPSPSKGRYMKTEISDVSREQISLYEEKLKPLEDRVRIEAQRRALATEELKVLKLKTRCLMKSLKGVGLLLVICLLFIWVSE